ncbi:uncharacterized protein LOC110023940 [Phalaenopsis equestris]|uniref:uncharacterized protein LOC110023940 n=1 Tax=Phalaenopsis equestris TaxID=78828 RepID=UPI0009E3EA57|nr:uncharacterized protein LOC110023940 [Phalaenopsis equestris]
MGPTNVMVELLILYSMGQVNGLNTSTWFSLDRRNLTGGLVDLQATLTCVLDVRRNVLYVAYGSSRPTIDLSSSKPLPNYIFIVPATFSTTSPSDLRCSPATKTLNPASPFGDLPVFYQPLLASGGIGNSGGNLSETMNNFAYTHCPNYGSPLFDSSLPKDLFKEDNHKPEFYDSLLGDNQIWGGNEWSFKHQANFIEPKEDLLSEFYKNCYTPQQYRYDDHHELDFNGVQSKPHLDNEFSAAYPEYPSHDVSGLKFYTPYNRVDSDKDYDRLSQIWSASLAHLGDLRNDFGNDSEDIGSGMFFEDFPHCIDTYAENLAQMFNISDRQKQPVQNTSMAAETEENYRHKNCCNYGEQLKTELLQIVSSLTAQVGRLEIQVEHLTHKVQDMADKLSGENNKFSAPILDHSGKSKAVLEESEATDSKSLVASADSNQKSDENGSIDDSDSSAPFDWEII